MAEVEDDDDFDWHEFNAWKKERYRAHVERNMEAYEKYVLMMEFLGFSHQPQGAGIRFTHASGLRIDFWKQSGKWTEVGTNKYTLGPRKMVNYVKAHLARILPNGVRSTTEGSQSSARPSVGTGGLRVQGNTTTPIGWPPKGNGVTWNTDPDTPPWET